MHDKRGLNRGQPLEELEVPSPLVEAIPASVDSFRDAEISPSLRSATAGATEGASVDTTSISGDVPQAESGEPSLSLAARAWALLKATARYSVNLMNPRYHIRQIKKDIAALRASAGKYKFEDTKHDRALLANALRGKLNVAIGVSEAVAWLGDPIALGLQAATGNLWWGTFGSYAICYASAVIGFQAAWYFANRDLYRATHPHLQKAQGTLNETERAGPETEKRNKLSLTSLKRLWEMEKDIWRVHLDAAKISLPLLLLATPVYIGLTYLMKTTLGPAARFSPIGAIAGGVDFALYELIYFRFMADRNEGHANRLAQKYCAGDDKK